MVREGKSFAEIKEALPKQRKTVDTTTAWLPRVSHQGRQNRQVSGTIGQMLNIKPIISVNEEGVYYTVDKARGTNQAYSKLIDILKDNLENTKCKVWVMHGGAKKEAQKIVERIKDHPGILTLEYDQISPALAFIPEKVLWHLRGENHRK